MAQLKKGTFISHQKYVRDLLNETRKFGFKQVDKPIEFNHRLYDTLEGTTIDKNSYKRLVGRLIYLTHIRLEIAL